MSSSPTALTSTTGSSISSPSPARSRLALIACGAIAQPCAEVVERRGWPVDVHPLPPLLHNQPQRIAAAVEARLDELAERYDRFAIGYADCGTYGALDELCASRGVTRLGGLHCYDLYAGADRLAAFFEQRPGTYLLTDFLVRSFHRSVIVELGLDRYPELRDNYFGHYDQMVWLAQRLDDELLTLAEQAAESVGLPLRVVETGTVRLEAALEAIVLEGAPR